MRNRIDYFSMENIKFGIFGNLYFSMFIFVLVCMFVCHVCVCVFVCYVYVCVCVHTIAMPCAIHAPPLSMLAQCQT